MSLLDRFLGVLAPHECLGCGAEGSLFCAACSAQLTPVKQHCYRCSKPTVGGLTCQSCRAASHLYAVLAATEYKTVAKELVWKLKFASTQAAADRMARQMTPLIKQLTDVVIVPVPTATSRVRQRGYDQAKLLARALASRSGLPYASYLAREGQAHQVGASRQQRLQQLHNAFRVTKPQLVKNAHILLVDDVLTTGSTLETAAAALITAGAARVEATVFARA